MAPSFQGLDRATAPPAATAKKMLDTIDGRWWCVYIGGPYSGGHGWSPEVVREYVRHGIDRFMLTYVGQQAGAQFKEGELTRERGRKDAREALALAKNYGYTGDFPLCLDVELSTFNHSPSKTVEYTRAWCATVHEAGARPGVYANPAPLQAMAKGKVPAEFVWIASWVSTTASRRDPHEVKGMPANLWERPGQRAWQYAGIIKGKPCNVLGFNVDINVADLGCLAPAPNGKKEQAPKRVRALRRGDRGPLVVRATHRLSVLRSRKTGRPYLDGPRSRFDAETETALKAFQSEHGLAASGRYGRESARALLKAVKKARPAHNGAKPEIGATNLPALVRDFRRLEAQADRAWQRLEVYGRERGRVLERAKDRADDSGMAGIMAGLAGIEKQLATLVELERQDVELERQELELARQELVLERQELELAAGATAAKKAAAMQAAATQAAATQGAATQAADTEAARYIATAEVDEMAAVASPGATGAFGSNGAGTTADKPRRVLKDLSDEELDRRIDLLDRRIDQSRKLRIARYARAEKELAELTGKPVLTPVVKPGKKPDKKPVKEPGKEPGKEHAEGPPRRPAVKALQRALNKFSETYLDGLAPLEVDGKKGTETDRRIRTIKYYLGYGGAERRSAAVPRAFLRRLKHPRSLRFSGARMLARAEARRRKQRNAAKRLTAGPIEGTPKHIIDTIVLPIAQKCGINRTPAMNDAANAQHGPTNTGNRSDHQGPGNVAWAADISNGGSPTPEMDKLARSLAQRFDIPWSGAGLVNATHGGYRYQLIYRTTQGGNHFNHVHFGVRDV
jgi:peptidoglycan hydrolase-like protein with peptidoglycan-binding domain